MKTIHLFKITEDSKKFDVVEMIYDELENIFIIRWKWTSMNDFTIRRYKSQDEAYEFYKSRKNFAVHCN